MASKCESFASLVLLFVLVGTASCYYLPTTAPISNVHYEEIQFLGKFAIDQYNSRNNAPHLYFVQVVSGDVMSLSEIKRLWMVNLEARNCTQSGSATLYIAVVGENLGAPDVQAYHSNYTYVFFRKYYE